MQAESRLHFNTIVVATDLTALATTALQYARAKTARSNPAPYAAGPRSRTRAIGSISNPEWSALQTL